MSSEGSTTGAAGDSAPPPASVPGNDWTLIEVAAAGELEPVAKISVVVEEQGELTAAALEAQSYPGSLVEVVGPDDRSRPGGDVVVLLGAGTLPAPGFLAAHARWHHAVADAVSVAAVDPIDGAGLDPAAVRSAGDGLAALLAPRRISDEDPFGLAIDLTSLLTDRQGGLFLATALGTLAVRRETYLAAGGPADPSLPPPLRRLDLAYRLACAGALFVPEPDAVAWSVAGRAEARLAAAIAAAASSGRTIEVDHPRAAALIPLPPFRPPAGARRLRRPAVAVNVDAGDAPAEEVVATIERVLDGRLGDLELRIQVDAEHPAREAIAAAADRDPRATIAPPSTEGRCESPVQIQLPPVAMPDPRTLADLTRLLASEDAGTLHVTVPGAPPDETMIEVLSTPALMRARRLAAARGEGPDDVLAELFGERWVSGVEASVRRHGVDEPHITEHGPLAAATDLDHERTQHLRFRDRADDLEDRSAGQEERVLAERLRTREERLRAEHLESLLRKR